MCLEHVQSLTLGDEEKKFRAGRYKQNFVSSQLGDYLRAAKDGSWELDVAPRLEK